MKWKTAKLGELISIARGGSPRPIKSYLTEEIDGINWIKIGDTEEGEKYIHSTKEKIKKSGIKSSRFVKKGDFLLSNSMSFGRPYILQIDGCIHDGWLVLTDYQDFFDADFLYYLLSSPIAKKQFERLAKGALVSNLNIDLVSEVEVSYPSLLEQKQIVKKLDSAFADIDKAISATKKIILASNLLLERFSDNYMLNKENQFKSAIIDDLFDLSTGGTPSTKKTEYYIDGEIPWLVSGDIHQHEIIDCEGRITEEGMNNSNAKFLPIDSVLIALNGQGKTRGTVAMLRIKATCNQSLVSIYPKNSKIILTDYLYFNLKNRYSEIRKITGDSGNDRRGLNMTLIGQIPFSYPEDIKEQRRYVEKSKNLIDHINHLNKIYEMKLVELSNLKTSMLIKSFSDQSTKDVA